jgi:hypothetical protein
MSSTMKRFLHAAVAVGVFALGTVLAPNANAGCADAALKVSFNSQGPSSVKPVSYRLTSASRQSSDNAQPSGSDITGMWQFAFLVNGQLIDWGFTQFHSDGMELTNSALRAPATGNYCMGVWKKTGPSTYKVSHRALNYDAGGTLLSLGIINEEVTVDKKGDTYTGTFTIDFFDSLGHNVGHGAGDITAKRITVD